MSEEESEYELRRKSAFEISKSGGDASFMGPIEMESMVDSFAGLRGNMAMNFEGEFNHKIEPDGTEMKQIKFKFDIG